MDINSEHASMSGKKINPFFRAVTEIFKFFIAKLFMGHPVYFLVSTHHILKLFVDSFDNAFNQLNGSV